MSELYDLPEGWEWKSIHDLTIKTKNLKPKENPESRFTYIDISSIDNSLFKITEPKFILGKDAPSRAKKEVVVDDIIYSTTRPNLKNIAIVELRYDRPIASTGFCILRVNSLITNRYLFYYLLTGTFFEQIEHKVRGAQYPAVSDTDVKQSLIPLPTLQEQKRMVSKLDLLFEKIDKAIALHQKNMYEADGFMGSVLNEVFGELEGRYSLQPLSTVIKINSGIALPKIFKNVEYTDGEFEFFKVAQMNNDKRVMKGADLNFTLLQSKEFKIKLFPKGSILIPKRGGAILTNKKRILEREASYDSNIMGLKANNEILSDKFLFTFLNSIDLKNYIDTTTIPQVNNKHIDMMNIPLPPLNIQQKTVTYLDKVSEKTEKIKSIQTEKMESLKALKASLLDKAFRGEL